MTIDMPVRDADVPTGSELIASYDDYGEAQRALDRLADERFPVERLKVVGHGLTLVEDVQGRRTMGRAASEGALNGALIAGFIGLLFGLLNWFDPLISAVALGLLGVTFGAAFGALFGLLAQASMNGERGVSSVRSLRARRYDLLADIEIAQAARSRLQS
jgi:uncharacterized membrane protein